MEIQVEGIRVIVGNLVVDTVATMGSLAMGIVVAMGSLVMDSWATGSLVAFLVLDFMPSTFSCHHHYSTKQWHHRRFMYLPKASR